MRNGFTLIEVLLAAIILGLGLTGILVSVAQSQQMMLAAADLETAQEVMDLGEMAYPLESVKDEDDLDVRETRATELWSLVSDERLTREQEEKFHGYTWERVALNKTDKEDDIKRLGNLYTVRITVTWGERGQGSGKKRQESYVTFWRKPE
ncbi:MAG: prepilin-type N-terminal cleavage/methylation domain-containing protein [Kiritimatiellia bacterium]